MKEKGYESFSLKWTNNFNCGVKIIITVKPWEKKSSSLGKWAGDSYIKGGCYRKASFKHYKQELMNNGCMWKLLLTIYALTITN